MAANNVVSESRVVCFIGYIVDRAFLHVQKAIFQSQEGKSPWRTEWTPEENGREDIALHVGRIAYDGRSCGIVIGMPVRGVSALRASRLVGCVDDNAVLIVRAMPEQETALGLSDDDPFAYAVIKDSRVPYSDLTNAVLLVGKGWLGKQVPSQIMEALVKQIIETFIFPPPSDQETGAGSTQDEKIASVTAPDERPPTASAFVSSDNPDALNFASPASESPELPMYG